MKKTLQTRLVVYPHLKHPVSEYICDACGEAYAQFEHPLFLASNSFEGTGRRATVHSHCYTPELAEELVGLVDPQKGGEK